MSTPPIQLADWRDTVRTLEWLRNAGLGKSGAHSKAQLFAQAAEQMLLAGVPTHTGTVGCYCPGRLEVLGKHTDYAGGRSLIAAPELGVAMLMCAGNAGQLLGHSLQDEASLCVPLRDPITPKGWALYPTTVLRRLARNFPDVELGCHLACASDLPLAAGMSSSSALMTATLLCALRLFRLEDDARFDAWSQEPEARAMLASCVENGDSLGTFVGDHGVGTFGGSEDHTAMLCARPAQLSQYSFAPIAHERTISLPEHVTFVVAQSGVIAEKAAGALASYNRLALMVRELEHVAAAHGIPSGESHPSLAAILRHDGENGPRLERALENSSRKLHYPVTELTQRLQHFQLESETLIPGWPDRWDANAAGPIGQLAERSTAAARDWLGNQVPETLWLTEALLHAGAWAASPFGAGFGGSVWALVDKAELGALLENLRAQTAPNRAMQAELAKAQAIDLGPAAIVF